MDDREGLKIGAVSQTDAERVALSISMTYRFFLCGECVEQLWPKRR